MNIYIIESNQQKGVLPYNYFKRKCECYVTELEAKYKCKFWCMHSECNRIARETYAKKTSRQANITSLVYTIDEADELFELFKIYANVWAYQICG
ncbi:hypothetical protein [Robinsoniella sp. KNHs210]|uniref:hypothetical protein n=1 Tax=Robinsoniella sp. KNHs210 TaxID=1469950 RepID=UPI0006941DA1|nr:hypothetical protein [Robinsoniella sp. KNHs210]